MNQYLEGLHFLVTVDYMSWMDPFSTRLTNIHPGLFNDIPPIPSLVNEFACVPYDVKRYFILGSI
jgi:hypothetical protein